ncbi:MAG TPA: cysteine--tRNA ligase [Candidatus Saccharimonadales bacterium]|nr:cysteine--tRNA ligase [Candidatus Saccharimonadales bacterium]
MKLYNTLTRSVEPFQPLRNNTAHIYTCGPTVYNHAHIGNLSSFIFADTLRRVVSGAGYDVVHAMNYTDVDDKTIRRSREQFPDEDPRVALHKLTNEYIALFLDDMSAIGNDINVMQFLRATDTPIIEGMQQLIITLYQQGFAYIADDGVYFSIEAYRKSGKTYGQLLELTASNTSEARIQNDEYDKDSVHDFALWKKQKDNEPAWQFTLDGQDMTGRPGWHIECSVMSRHALGQPFDIHTGGIDLVFPHHENEIAQSTAGEENPLMAQFFTHSNHTLIDGKKMSKSLNNFYTLTDIMSKGFNPLAFRLKVLQSHYRNQVNFTWESLEAAQNLLHNLHAWADLKHQSSMAHQPSETLDQSYKAALKGMLDAVQDDLNTAEAISYLAALANEAEEQGIDAAKLQPLLNVADRLFGLQLADRPDITTAQKALLATRQNARDTKDWATSDKLRDELTAQGIGVRDTANGPVWYRQ